MRISDWSSDVCSSDLGMAAAAGPGAHAQRAPARRKAGAAGPPNVIILITDQTSAGLTKRSGYKFDTSPRSEERREGKECVSTCRSRWSTEHKKKKPTNKKHRCKTHEEKNTPRE